MTLFVPIVHERAPSHGPPEKTSSRFCIQHQACSVRPTESRIRTDCSILLLLVLPSSHQPPPTALGHPVAHLTMLVLKEKKSSCPGNWKLNQSTSLRSNVSQSRRCNSIIYNEAVFRFVSPDSQPFSFAQRLALSFTPSLCTRISVCFIYTFPNSR